MGDDQRIFFEEVELVSGKVKRVMYSCFVEAGKGVWVMMQWPTDHDSYRELRTASSKQLNGFRTWICSQQASGPALLPPSSHASAPPHALTSFVLLYPPLTLLPLSPLAVPSFLLSQFPSPAFPRSSPPCPLQSTPIPPPPDLEVPCSPSLHALRPSTSAHQIPQQRSQSLISVTGCPLCPAGHGRDGHVPRLPHLSKGHLVPRVDYHNPGAQRRLYGQHGCHRRRTMLNVPQPGAAPQISGSEEPLHQQSLRLLRHQPDCRGICCLHEARNDPSVIQSSIFPPSHVSLLLLRPLPPYSRHPLPSSLDAWKGIVPFTRM